MKILVKSDPVNFEKEKYGIKPNTVRKLDGKDTILIRNSEDEKDFFIRTINDITTWEDTIIISFEPLKDLGSEKEESLDVVIRKKSDSSSEKPRRTRIRKRSVTNEQITAIKQAKMDYPKWAGQRIYKHLLKEHPDWTNLTINKVKYWLINTPKNINS